MLTERHLEIFVALAEEEHFGAAAQRVGITQPPLSQGLRLLEALLGVRLFDRGRGVALTEEGELLLPHARAALASLTELRAAACARAGGEPHGSGSAWPLKCPGGWWPTWPPRRPGRASRAGSAW